MQSITKTKVRYAYDEDGKQKFAITSETAWNKQLKEIAGRNAEAQAKGEALEEIPDARFGTFGYNLAQTVDEAVTLAGGNGVGEYENIDVFLGVFNYGASLRQDNEANDILGSDNFEAWEGVKDVSYAVAQKMERAKMTPEEQAVKSLNKAGFSITPEQLRAALALIQQGALGASAGA